MLVGRPDEPAGAQAKADLYLRTDDLTTNLSLRTARGGVVTIASQGLKLCISLAGTIVLARLLTPGDYGLVGMVGAITGFISIFASLGLSSATIQSAEISKEQVSTLFWVNVAFSVAVVILTAALAPLVSRFYGEPRLTPVTIAYAIAFIFAGLTVQHDALLRRRLRFVAVAGAEIFSILAGLSTAIVIAWHGGAYWALVGFQLSQGAAYTVAVWVACPWRPGLPVRHSGVRSMLAFGGNLTGFSILNYFARNLDNVLVGRVWGSWQLGLYERAYQALLLPLEQINKPISNVAVPALSRLVDSPDRYRAAYLRILEKVVILTMPLTVVLISTSDWIVLLLLGPNWADVSRIFAWLGIAALLQPICNTTGWLFMTQDRTADMFRWGVIGSTITVIGIVIGLPWGAVGVAASYSLTYVCVVAPLVVWFVGRAGPVRTSDVYRTVAPCGVAAVATLLVLYRVRQLEIVRGPIAGIAVCLAIACVVTTAVLATMPAGRRTLRDLRDTALLVLRTRAHRRAHD